MDDKQNPSPVEALRGKRAQIIIALAEMQVELRRLEAEVERRKVVIAAHHDDVDALDKALSLL